jgi:hypothetical protein
MAKSKRVWGAKVIILVASALSPAVAMVPVALVLGADSKSHSYAG